MPFVLTNDSTIACGHTGTVGLAATTKLTIDSANVLLLSDVIQTIAGCKNPTDTNTGSKTCMTVVAAQGTATKLTAGTVPVVIDTLTGTTDGVNPPATPGTISATVPAQSKLTAV
jgi:hypothetical protein